MSSSSSAAARVFSGYRRLFRARKILFEGDHRAIQESTLAIRSEFEKHRTVAPSGDHFEGLVSMITEAEDMLLHGIVQGKLNEGGNYEVKIKAEHADGDREPSSGGSAAAAAAPAAAVTEMEPLTADMETTESGLPKVQVTRSCKSSSSLSSPS